MAPGVSILILKREYTWLMADGDTSKRKGSRYCMI